RVRLSHQMTRHGGDPVDAANHQRSAIRDLLRSSDLPDVDRDSALHWLMHAASIRHTAAELMKVAFLGPHFSYSHLATIDFFGEAAAMVPLHTIEAVFDAMHRGKVLAGVVPIENSTDGRVVDTLGMFVQHRTPVCGEIRMPIHHNLLGRGNLADVRAVHSKPQALSQCRRWLADHLPEAELVPVSSTTQAAQNAAQQTSVAAIASLPAGRHYGLEALETSIQDNPNNLTRFAVLGNEKTAPTGNDKTLMLFSLRHESGTLAAAMNAFAGRDLNLTWIESFPMPGRPNEYWFIVELEGHANDSDVSKAITDMKTCTRDLNVLGSYPIG
ncbi:MAG: prephenate dehydratase, partial [Planctomycetota bacterium]